MRGDEVAVMVVLILMIVSVSIILLTLIRGRQKVAEIKAAAHRGEAETGRENAMLRTEVGRLHQRLAALESIVVDPADRTAREIESLR